MWEVVHAKDTVAVIKVGFFHDYFGYYYKVQEESLLTRELGLIDMSVISS